MVWYEDRFPRYVPVGERRAKAQKKLATLRKKGKAIEPVSIGGRTIARTFWGKGWCDHLESFSDYSNRLPRGRMYVRNGSVCHLSVTRGRIEALVSGTRLYTVEIRIRTLAPDRWKAIQRRCAGQIGSLLELIQGKLSGEVMTVVTDRKAGLFPGPKEIELACSCPDWATMCKHVAAVLYGVGSRLDEQPELLFTLRGVDPEELIETELALPGAEDGASKALADDQLSGIFGIDLDVGAAPGTSTPSRTRARKAKPSAPTPARPRAASSAAAPRSASGKARKRTTNRATTRVTGPLPKLRPTGTSIARLRRQLGLSAAAFAEELGVSASSVYRWESTTGRVELQDRVLRALAALRRTRV